MTISETHIAPPKRLMLVVIDGLGAAPLRRAISEGHAPHIAELLEAGASFDEAISPFPSLTPVCLASIATGVGPDHHRVPSLGWYNRGRGRFIEYGSSFSASGVEGARRGIEDVVVDLNHQHLSDRTLTVFEHLQDNGLTTAAINYLVSRGRTRHTVKHDYAPVRAVAKRTKVNAVYGPDHLYFGELFGGNRPRMPQMGIKRPLDWGGGRIARWLLQNTDSRFILLYLGQHDAASHRFGPDQTQKAIRVADKAIGRAIEAGGGLEKFSEEVALMICADHGQTRVDTYAALEDVFDDIDLFRGSRTHDAEQRDLAIVGSNRVAMLYRTRDRRPRVGGVGYSAAPNDEWIAKRAGESAATDFSTYLNPETRILYVLGANAKDGGELRIRLAPDDGLPTARSAKTHDPTDRWRVEGDLELLDITRSGDTLHYGEYPDALRRLASAVTCVNTGDVLVSAAPGWEFRDIGGSAHTGGSHGSLHKIDSTAPLITYGLADSLLDQGLATVRLTDIAPMILRHFKVNHAVPSDS